MRKLSSLLAIAAALVLSVGGPALAKSASHAKTGVSCKQINAAVAAGKSADDIATDLKVTPERVKQCTSPTAKHHHTTKTGS